MYMLLHNNPFFSIYFGNAEDELDPDQYLNYPPGIRLLALEPYKKLKKMMQLEGLMFLRQVHGDAGLVINQLVVNQKEEPFKTEGDFLITDAKHMGIGMMTGDCLPIVFFDNVHRVVAIVHAGWKSAVLEIAPKTVQMMQEQFGTKLEHLRVFFGPSAKSCCYEVGETFIEQLEAFPFIEEILRKEQQGLMFDLPLFNRLQLEDIGIAKEAFKLEYNFCTICDTSYCSFRRDGQKAHRQMTVVALK